MKSKKVKKTYSSFSKKKSPRKIKISKVLPVEFSCHYNSQIYLGNFPKEVILLFIIFLPEDWTVKLALCVPSHKCKQNENSFSKKEC